MTALVMPFEGLPGWAQMLFTVAFVLIVATFAWTGVLFILSRRVLGASREPDPGAADDFLWVFLIPALNEELTIEDSVGRLLAVEARHKLVIVIDDGSTDGTKAALARIDDPLLDIVRREAPDARVGKAAALNAGWRRIHELLASGEWTGWQHDRVVVAVVDADGRLDPAAPSFAAPHFRRPRVGGLQVLVRIYNRRHPLTWCQDVEFSVYGLLFQAGRAAFGAAGMGGNGQFNRLSALDAIADAAPGGPWRNRLTEDQDLGLRLLEAGWDGVAESGATVEQQGLPDLRRLLRQRTRWAQGNLQAMSHLGAMLRLERSWLVRLEQVAYLLQPVLQAVVGIAFAVSIALAILDVADFWNDDGWWQLLFFFLLGFGGVILGSVARGAQRGAKGIVTALAVVPVYAAYSWLIWPALGAAALRQLSRRRDWAKTDREPVAADRPTS